MRRFKCLSISDLDGQELCLPGTGKEFRPLLDGISKQQVHLNIHILPSFYQAYYNTMEHHFICINRYIPEENNNPDDFLSIPLEDMPPICSSFLIPEKGAASQAETLYHYLQKRIDYDFKGTSQSISAH